MQGAWVFACVVPGVTVTLSGTDNPQEEVVVVQIGRDPTDPRNKLYNLLNRRLQVKGFNPDDHLDSAAMEDVEERLGGVVETVPKLPKVTPTIAYCYVCPPHVKPKDTMERSRLEDAHLAMTTRNLESARDGMKEVNQNALFEVASYNKPSPMVLRVMKAVLTLVGEGEATGSWEDIRNLMRRDDFLPNIRDFDGENVSEETKKVMRSTIADPQFTHKAAKHASKALGPLQQWVCAMMNYIDTHFAPAESPRKRNLALQSPRKECMRAENKTEITVDQSLRDQLESNRFSKVATSIGWCELFGVKPVESCGFELVLMTRSDFDNRLHSKMIDHDLPSVFEYDSFQEVIRGVKGSTKLNIDGSIFHLKFERMSCTQFYFTDSQRQRLEEHEVDPSGWGYEVCMKKIQEKILFLNLSNNPIFPHVMTKRKSEDLPCVELEVLYRRFAWVWAGESDRAAVRETVSFQQEKSLTAGSCSEPKKEGVDSVSEHEKSGKRKNKKRK